jgi:hypothetical protein
LVLKYERLPLEELNKLEEEFVKFLVVNGITSDDWLSIKENEPLNADKIVDQFSDVVWEGVLRKVSYLDKIEQDVSYFFKCNKEEIELVRILSNEAKPVKQNANKRYTKQREVELFEMISSGCVISQGENFEKLI